MAEEKEGRIAEKNEGKEGNKGEEEEKPSKRRFFGGGKYSWRGSGQGWRGKEPKLEGKKFPVFTIALIIILIPLLYIVGVYGIAYAETPQAQRAATFFIETIPGEIIDFWRDIASPEGKIGTIWETDINQSKRGILFKDFELLLFNTKTVPAGKEWNFQFEFEAKNVDASDIPVTLGCYIKGKEDKDKVEDKEERIEGEIKPDITITDVTRTTPICTFSGEQTELLKEEKTATVVGTASFPFTTKDVSLDVYFITYEQYETCEKQGFEDYFECYNLPLKNPIRAVYNGEPVSLAIGVGAEQEKQPVVVSYADSPEGIKFYPLIGLLVSNEWSGNVNEITSFEIWLPEGMEIDEELSYTDGEPTYLCPFTHESEQEIDGEQYNKYSVSSEFLDDVNFKETIAIETHKKFMCFLKSDNSFVDRAGEGIYWQGKYMASIGYVYQLKDKVEVISIAQESKALTSANTDADK